MSPTPQNLASDSWGIADLLRGDFKQSQYGRIILPFALLRRLECVLEGSKEAVLAENEKVTAMALPEETAEQLMLRDNYPGRPDKEVDAGHSGAFWFVDFLNRNGCLFNARDEPVINDTGLTAASTLLIAETDPKQKDVIICLVMTMLAVPNKDE